MTKKTKRKTKRRTEAVRCWGIEHADGSLDKFVTNFHEDCRMSVQDGERVVRLVARRATEKKEVRP